MENNIVKPDKYSYETYCDFIKTYVSLEKFVLKDEINTFEKFVSHCDHEFGIFLEDFIVNDETFQKFAKSNAVKCIGCMLMTHAYTMQILREDKENKDSLWSISAILQYFVDDIPSQQLLKEAVSTEFLWSGSAFYRWNGTIWTPCLESDINLDNLESRFDSKITIDTVNLTVPLVDLGATWIRDKLMAFNEAVPVFNNDLTYLVDYIKMRKAPLNTRSDMICCSNVTVNFAKGNVAPHFITDLFSVRLPHDPIMKPTDLVTEFFCNFKCDKI